MRIAGDERTLRVGLIGAGMISPFHLAAWAKVPSAKVVAICDSDRGRAAERAGRFAIPAVHDDAEAMLSGEALDAVDIASPREWHVAHVRLAASHRAAVLCQKPLAPTLAEAEALAAELGRSCRLMVHENWRFRPVYRLIKRWLDDGRIGAIRSARMVVRSAGLVPGADGRLFALDRQPFMRDLPRMFVSESLIHQIDVVRWLAGPLSVRAAALGRACPAIRGEDRASILMTAADGMPVLVDGDMAIHGYPPRSTEELEIAGTRGTLRYADLRLSCMTGAGREEIVYDRDAIYQASFDACIGHFVECLKSGAPFETDPADNLETLRLVEDAYRLAGPIHDLSHPPARP